MNEPGEFTTNSPGDARAEPIIAAWTLRDENHARWVAAENDFKREREKVASLSAALEAAKANGREVRWKAFRSGFQSGFDKGRLRQAIGYEEMTAEAEATAERYCRAYEPGALNKPVFPAALPTGDATR